MKERLKTAFKSLELLPGWCARGARAQWQTNKTGLFLVVLFLAFCAFATVKA